MVIKSVMELKNPVLRVVGAIFCYPLVSLFQLLLTVRHFYYDHLYLSWKSKTKIIGIGSLSAGGTGKTPTTEFLANALVSHGCKIGVVSGGYRKQTSGTVLVSDGLKLLCNVYASGDEAYLLAKHFLADKLNIPVASGMNRNEAVALLESLFDLDYILLDDGFQYRKIYKTFEILVHDAFEGESLNWLLPIGRLRDSKSRVRSADVLVIHKTNDDEKPDIRWSKGLPVVTASYRAVELRNFIFGNTESLNVLQSRNIVLFTALGHPKAWNGIIMRLADTYECRILKNIHFRDHHWYSEIDLKSIFSFMRDDYILLTTEKDAVKIEPHWIPERFHSNVFILKSEMKMTESVVQQILQKV